jgi:hypothetical protein
MEGDDMRNVVMILIAVMLHNALALGVLLSMVPPAMGQPRYTSTGKLAVCDGGYPTRGIAGLTNQTAKQLQFRCVDDYVRQGYERVPE